ncbi:hypothetical protein Goari_021362 [Gossypium aridum]|uniref:Uncharacterized protein n=1 Tax=Gossypium aridum TaxID=34290 RepID=A0A7J8YE49_GOSAI|nr:hypothetical protein [Gossypium aridum]
MPLKWKKKIMFASENCTYVSFKMSKGNEESVELGWDFSLRVQSRRVVAMHSVWLIEEDNGGIESGNGNKRPHKESRNHIISGVEGSVVVREDRLVGKTHCISMATRSCLIKTKSGDLLAFVGLLMLEERMTRVLEKCRLVDVGYSKIWFTWERRNISETNIRERLDKGVMNEGMMNMFPNLAARHLLHLYSAKLIRRKRDRIKRELTNKLGELLGKERDDDTLEELIDAKIQLNLEIEKDEMFWEQRAKYEDGRVVVEETKMEKITQNYFQNLFSTSGTEVTDHILVGMLNCIFNEANLMLTKRHTVDEIVTALKGIGPTNA